MFLVIPVKLVDPLMAHANPIGIVHEATDLLRAPFVHQLTSDPSNQARQSLRHFPGGASTLITDRLGLFWQITMLCFTLVGKAERVPMLALLPLPNDSKCCSYSMNLGL